MAYIVVVKHDTKGTVLIPTEIKDAQKAIEQAKMENQGPGYDWENATLGYIPDEWEMRENAGTAPIVGPEKRKTSRLSPVFLTGSSDL